MAMGRMNGKIKHFKGGKLAVTATILNWIADVALLIDMAALVVDINPQMYNFQHSTLYAIHFYVSLILIAEIVVRIAYRGNDFWHNRWDKFDLAVTVIGCLSMLPWIASVRFARTVRLLRALRLFTLNTQLRLFAHALVTALPRVGWASLFFAFTFTIYAIVGISLFSAEFPQYFGSFQSSLFSLFQIMTLESWASGIARPIMEVFPIAAPFYFVSFIIMGSYILLNMLAGVITSSAFEIYAKSLRKREGRAFEKTHEQILDEIIDLRIELNQLRNLLEAQKLAAQENESAKDKDGCDG